MQTSRDVCWTLILMVLVWSDAADTSGQLPPKKKIKLALLPSDQNEEPNSELLAPKGANGIQWIFVDETAIQQARLYQEVPNIQVKATGSSLKRKKRPVASTSLRAQEETHSFEFDLAVASSLIQNADGQFQGHKHRTNDTGGWEAPGVACEHPRTTVQCPTTPHSEHPAVPHILPPQYQETHPVVEQHWPGCVPVFGVQGQGHYYQDNSYNQYCQGGYCQQNPHYHQGNPQTILYQPTYYHGPLPPRGQGTPYSLQMGLQGGPYDHGAPNHAEIPIFHPEALQHQQVTHYASTCQPYYLPALTPMQFQVPMNNNQNPPAMNTQHILLNSQVPNFYIPEHPYSELLGRFCQLSHFQRVQRSKLMKGGFGLVYSVIDQVTGSIFAMKRILAAVVAKSPHLIKAEETIQHYLDHPNIAKHHCTMVDGNNGDVYFLLEHIPGDDLTLLVEKNGSFGGKAIASIVGQVLLALRYLHGKCIAHRDIKPENVMLTPEGRAVLIDFGLAAVDCENNLTRRFGTVSYMAPEVIAAKWGQKYGRSADLFSLGLTVYFLRTRVHLFEAHTVNRSQMLEMRSITPWSGAPPTGSSAVDRLIEILTTLDPEQRWTHVHQNFSTFQKLPIFFEFVWA